MGITLYADADMLLALGLTPGILVQEQPLVQQEGVYGGYVRQAPQLAANVQQRIGIVPFLHQTSVNYNQGHDSCGLFRA